MKLAFKNLPKSFREFSFSFPPNLSTLSKHLHLPLSSPLNSIPLCNRKRNGKFIYGCRGCRGCGKGMRQGVQEVQGVNSSFRISYFRGGGSRAKGAGGNAWRGDPQSCWWTASANLIKNVKKILSPHCTSRVQLDTFFKKGNSRRQREEEQFLQQIGWIQTPTHLRVSKSAPRHLRVSKSAGFRHPDTLGCLNRLDLDTQTPQGV